MADATRYRLAVIPGDGVGPEVTAAARHVLETTAEAFGFGIDWTDVAAGGNAIDKFGVAIRPEDVVLCGEQDAVLLGAVGGPRWDDPRAPVRPEQALFTLRGTLGLFANLRPVMVYPQLFAASPLKPDLLDGVDLLIVRELAGGIYFGERAEPSGDVGGRSARDTLPYTEAEVRRIVRLGFEEAKADFPDVTVNHQLVDSAAMLLVRRPADFDVIITENLFGDILSDEAAVLAGSLGMLPSASLGTRQTEYGTFGLYEPIHGSAPDIAGRDIANPLGTILSAAMLLRWSLGREDAAEAVERAVARALDEGHRTADLAVAGPAVDLVGTQSMAQLVAERIETP